MDPFSCPPDFSRLPETWQQNGLLFSIHAEPFTAMLMDSGGLPRSDALFYVANENWEPYYADYFASVEALTELCNYFKLQAGTPCRIHGYWVAKDNQLVGSLEVYSPRAEHHTRDASDTLCLSYYVMNSQRRNGIASQMVSAFQNLAAAQGFTTLCAQSNWDNPYSHKVLLNTGFSDLGLNFLSISAPSETTKITLRNFVWRSDGKKAHRCDWPYQPDIATRLLPAPG